MVDGRETTFSPAFASLSEGIFDIRRYPVFTVDLIMVIDFFGRFHMHREPVIDILMPIRIKRMTDKRMDVDISRVAQRVIRIVGSPG